MVPTTDRAAVGVMLTMSGVIDVIVPRGGRSLIERVIAESRIPLFQHLEGLCHTYVDAGADLAMARGRGPERQNAPHRRLRRTETLLVDRKVAASHLAPLVEDLLEAGCEVRGDEAARAVDPRVKAAAEADWSTEYLDAVISVKLVDGVDGAIAHIGRYGSHHTESIITDDAATAARFLAESTAPSFCTMPRPNSPTAANSAWGAEIGISTGKLHARGPVGVEQLTSFKYVVRGSGQVRP